MDFKKKINEVKDVAIKDLMSLLSYRTILEQYNPNSDEPFGKENKEALHFLLDLAQKDGFLVSNVDNYAMHIEYGPKDSEILGVLAHIDVVPVSDRWKTNPFEPQIIDGKLYARGAIDDKGPLIASYYALKIIKESKLPVSKRVRLICGCDEESGSRCLRRYFEKEEMPSLGFSPDAEFPLIYGEKGSCHFNIVGKLTSDSLIKTFEAGQRYNIVPDLAKMTLTKDFTKEYLNFLTKKGYEGKVENNVYYAYGVSAHAMHPHKGFNASFILFEFLNEINKTELTEYLTKYVLFDYFGKKLDINYSDSEMGDLSFNLGIVEIKDVNIKLGFDCRIPLDDVEVNMKEKIENSLKNFKSLNVEFSKFGKRHYVSPQSFLVKTLMKAYTDVTNDFTNKPYTIGGGTYAKFIDNAVAFGPLLPNREDVVHQDNEYIMIDDFVTMIEIYTKAIYELIK